MVVANEREPMRARCRAVLLAAGALMALTLGCASGPARPQSPNDVVCLNEPQTGSHIVETRCFTRAELDERRKADQEMLEKAQMNSNRPARRRDQ
jgi:hypothetical protein